MPKLKETPVYIRNLLLPNSKAPQGRKVWSIDLETVWLPFLTATNVMGDTAIPLDALGAPIRLGYDKDGSVKFSTSGRPVTKVAKPLSDSVSLIRQNFVASLQQYAGQVAEEKQAEYAETVALAVKAGKPIQAHDKTELDAAIKLQIAEALRQAGEAEATGDAEATGEAEATTQIPAKELATVS